MWWFGKKNNYFHPSVLMPYVQKILQRLSFGLANQNASWDRSQVDFLLRWEEFDFSNTLVRVFEDSVGASNLPLSFLGILTNFGDDIVNPAFWHSRSPFPLRCQQRNEIFLETSPEVFPNLIMKSETSLKASSCSLERLTGKRRPPEPLWESDSE